MLLYLDVISTGPDSDNDEILQIMIKDQTKRTVFERQFKPTHKRLWPDTQLRFGITPGHVQNAAPLQESVSELTHLFNEGTTLVTFNWPVYQQQLQQAGIQLKEELEVIDVADTLADHASNQSKELDDRYFDDIFSARFDYLPNNEKRMYQMIEVYNHPDLMDKSAVQEDFRPEWGPSTKEQMEQFEQMGRLFESFHEQMDQMQESSDESTKQQPQKPRIYVRTFGCSGCLVPLLVLILLVYFFTRT